MATRRTWTAVEAVSHAKVCILYDISLLSLCIYYCHFYWKKYIFKIVKFSIVVGLVEIKLRGMEDASGISWSILDTDCKSAPNLQPTVNRVYKKDCTLSKGQTYTLQCESTNHGWWMSNYINIENSAYCEYAKEKRLINITITGKLDNSISIWYFDINVYPFDVLLEYSYFYNRRCTPAMSNRLPVCIQLWAIMLCLWPRQRKQDY